MMEEGVFSASDALVVVAIITALGTFLTAYVQNKAKKQNSAEHAIVLEKNTEFRDEVRESSRRLQAEVHGIAGDVRDVKADLRDLRKEHKETRFIVDEHMREG
jgi:flagellar motility protein MotE (MotC chaperone)